MDSKLLIFAVTLITLSYAAEAEGIQKERQRRSAWDAPELFNLEHDEETAETDLQELEKKDLDEMKRGVFSCREVLHKCNWFKHCCGSLECSRSGVEFSGRCLPNLKKRAESVNLEKIQDADKKKREETVDLDNSQDTDEKDLQELQNEETLGKRGVFSCRGWNENCNWFKHCCDNLECSRSGVEFSGTCRIKRF